MHWLSTASAWFGLACLLIIAMYILKKRYEPKAISSHLLWRKALQEQEANKPWQRLKQRLLLWLQLIAAIIIVLSLMEPAIEKQLTKDAHAIILIDRSASMATSALEGGDSYLTQAKQDALQWIDQQYDGGAVTLITNGDYPSILLNRSQQKTEIVQAIQHIEPYYGISDDETALSLARALVDQNEAAVIHYFIDERFKAAPQSLQQAAAWQEQWHMYAATAAQHDDRIRSFTLTATDQTARAFVTVLHVAQEEELEINLVAYNEKGQEHHRETAKRRAQPEGITTFQIEGLPKAHYYMVELKQRQGDPNSYNNKQYGLLSEQASYQALLISEGNLFLEKALQLLNVAVTKLDNTSASGVPSREALEAIQFIIVDGNYERLAEQEEWKAVLDSYPLWIIDHPTEQEAAKLVQKEAVVHEHPVTQYFSMEDTYIAAIKQLDMSELSDYDVLVEYGGAPAIIAGVKQQKPFLRYGFALQDSDLPLRAPFPILMMQSIEYMAAGSSQQLGYMLVQSEPTLSLLAGTSSSYWQLLDGQQAKQQSEPIAIPHADRIIAPSLPGVYELVEQDEQGKAIQQRTAIVTADTTEFTAGSIATALEQAQSAPAGEQVQPATNGLSLLTPWLAALLLLLLLGEWEVYRRGL